MAARMLLSSSATILLCFSTASNSPVYPYAHYTSRPENDQFCQSGEVPFCPGGYQANTMPKFHSTDTLYVYSLKAPMLSFELGDLLGNYNVFRDAVGFHHVQSGKNLTVEWYAVGDVLNATFAHEPTNDSLVWCNQAAACVSDGIDEKRWKATGTPVKVAEINGTTFNSFAKWTEMDNTTNVFYQTWTVREQQQGGQMWVDPSDSSTWVRRAFANLAQNGAAFNQSLRLNYTRLNLYSEKPVRLGTAQEIFNNKIDVEREILLFYQWFQPHQSLSDLVKSYIDAYYKIVMLGTFILFYNETYWGLPVKSPYFNVTFDEVPQPKNPAY